VQSQGVKGGQRKTARARNAGIRTSMPRARVKEKTARTRNAGIYTRITRARVKETARVWNAGIYPSIARTRVKEKPRARGMQDLRLQNPALAAND
jgi:hypothetical protein